MNVLRWYDYTHGRVPELIDVIIEEETRLFVSAIGIPPREVVDRLHNVGILCWHSSHERESPLLFQAAY